MRPESSRRRPAGAAPESRIQVGKTHECDAHILDVREAEFDCTPRPITWSDTDSERVLEFIARCEQEARP
jgi:hypothetical protein